MILDNKSRVLVVGASGRIGLDVINGLIESKNFVLSATVRSGSINKPEVQMLISDGVEIRVADFSDPKTDFDALVKDIDIVVSTIDFKVLELQKPLIDAAKRAGVKRFIPSDYGTACKKGVREMFDEKLAIRDYVEASRIGYTFIDVGVIMRYTSPLTEPEQSDIPGFYELTHRIYGDGNQRTALIDGPDMGRFTALIISDPRTLNKYVFCHGDEKSQNEIWEIVQKRVGRKVDSAKVTEEQLKKDIAEAGQSNSAMLYMWQYYDSMWIRGDNTSANAAKVEYGGALDARELYPEFKAKNFSEFVQGFYRST